MTGTNHYLTGVGAAVVLKNPLLVIPVAFASHFVLDSLPHFGFLKFSKRRGKILLRVASVDALLFVLVIILTAASYPIWYIFAGLTAFSPDIAWMYRFIFKEKLGKLTPSPENAFNAWHNNIQKYERWWGVFIEIGFMGLLSGLLFF